jgi:hypothetical protein
MSRAQGHIANVLWVLFDHVIESQKQIHQERDLDMAMGKITEFLWLFLPDIYAKHVSHDGFKILLVFELSIKSNFVPYFEILCKTWVVYKLINKFWFIKSFPNLIKTEVNFV